MNDHSSDKRMFSLVEGASALRRQAKGVVYYLHKYIFRKFLKQIIIIYNIHRQEFPEKVKCQFR